MTVFPLKHLDIVIKKGYYDSNGKVALQLFDSESGELYRVATMNIEDVELFEDECFIKDWGENTGILQFLLENNIISLTGKVHISGCTIMNICKINNSSIWGPKTKENETNIQPTV